MNSNKRGRDDEMGYSGYEEGQTIAGDAMGYAGAAGEMPEFKRGRAQEAVNVPTFAPPGLAPSFISLPIIDGVFWTTDLSALSSKGKGWRG